jgi:hypothetical protein
VSIGQANARRTKVMKVIQLDEARGRLRPRQDSIVTLSVDGAEAFPLTADNEREEEELIYRLLEFHPACRHILRVIAPR